MHHQWLGISGYCWCCAGIMTYGRRKQVVGACLPVCLSVRLYQAMLLQSGFIAEAGQ